MKLKIPILPMILFKQILILFSTGIKSTLFCPKTSLVCYSFHKNTDNSVQHVIEYNQDANIGWVGFGVGDSMAGSDILLIWLKNSNEALVSTRKGVGYVMPVPEKNSKILVGNVETTITNNKVSIAFNSSGIDVKNKNWIWAYSKTNPKDPENKDSSIEIHDNFGVFNLDLEKDSFEQTENSDQASHSKLRFIHGVLLFFGWNVLPFFGILVTRFKTTLDVWWFRIHYILLGIASPVFVSIGIVLLIIKNKEIHFFHNWHQFIGFLVFILMFLQIILGIIIDKLYNSQRSRIPWYDKLHWLCGRILFLLAQINIILGVLRFISKQKADQTNTNIVPWTITTFVLYGLLLLVEFVVYAYLSYFKQKQS